MPRLLWVLALAALIAVPARARQFHADSTMAASSITDSTMTHAYRIYTADGESASLDAVVAAMEDADVVVIGEKHDDPVAHHLQLVLLAGAYRRFVAASDTSRPVALSMEMFERDVQPMLDEYLAGLITEQHFRRSSRPPGNYETDYRPLIEFARVHGLPVIASNAPRRYVNRVSRLGAASLDDLPPVARAWLPPLPYPDPLPAYRDKWQALMAEMMAEMAASSDSARATMPEDSTHTAEAMPEDSTHVAEAMPPSEAMGSAPADSSGGDAMHGGGTMMAAQALWDAAMAHAVTRYLDAEPEALVLHVVGSFHAEEGLGTPAQIAHYRPGTRTLVVIVQPTEDIDQFDDEALGTLGDFVILSDETRPRTMASSGG